MDIFRIAAAGFKFGSKIGTKAVEVATRYRLPINHKQWAKVIMRQFQINRATSGHALTELVRAEAKYSAKQAAANLNKPIIGQGMDIADAARTICDFAAKGDAVVLPFFIPTSQVGAMAQNSAFVEFRGLLQKQNMDAEILINERGVKVKGIPCFACAMTVVWQPHMQYDP